MKVSVVWFVGVTTGRSLVYEAFARWQPLLGDSVTVVGRDVALDAPPRAYRELLAALWGTDDTVGAVITSHKLAIFEAGRDLFASLDDAAQACGEINAIRRARDGLHGFARDPLSVGRVVDRIWPPGTSDHVVCLGAGGTAVALGHHLAARADPPRLHVVDRRREACDRLRAALGRRGVTTQVGDGRWDGLLREAPEGSLVVNATGMGKDRPGSPVSAAAAFPRGSVVWELNYRGDLSFLAHARRQATDRRLSVHDGWGLFCHGWAAALTAVLNMPNDPPLGDRFQHAAAAIRPNT